jgi:hypothetical protein
MPRYPARYPARASRSASVNSGRTGASTVEVDWVVVALIRNLLKRPEPRRRDRRRVPSND